MYACAGRSPTGSFVQTADAVPNSAEVHTFAACLVDWPVYKEKCFLGVVEAYERILVNE